MEQEMLEAKVKLAPQRREALKQDLHNPQSLEMLKYNNSSSY
jgi:hypothetical protein